ncbi:MAG TPA: hypothetical protein VGE66_02605 [Chitinophagaceae bacterium]
MEIVLTYQETVKDIKKQFNCMFPYLKLEFFCEPHVVGQGSPFQKMVPPSTLLGEIHGILREGVITLVPESSVKDVEQAFQGHFGLPVQVFRKQKDVWLETTSTDFLSLAEQNEMGRRASEVPVRQVEEQY